MLRLLFAFPAGLLVAGSFFVFLANISGLKQVPLPQAQPLAAIQLFAQRHSRKPELVQRRPLVPPRLAPTTTEFHFSPPATSVHQTQANIELSVSAIALPLAKVSLSPLKLPALTASVTKAELSSPNNLLSEGKALRLILGIQPSYQVKPQYPFNAQRRNLEGKVELEFIVGSDGRVKASSIKVLAAEPALIFEQAARRAVQNWRFVSTTTASKLYNAPAD